MQNINAEHLVVDRISHDPNAKQIDVAQRQVILNAKIPKWIR